jgi:hypothetical protein
MVVKRKREIVLAAVAVALIAIAALRIRSATSGVAPTQAPLAGAANTRPQPADQKGEVTQVDLQALDSERPGPVNGTRNPFRFRPAPAPPPTPGPPPLRGGSGSQTGALPPIIEPVGPPPPPRIALKFIGQVESAAIGRVAVLTDGRGVYRGKEGDIIEGRYRILRIGVESIDLAYLDGRGRQTIRQTGQ